MYTNCESCVNSDLIEVVIDDTIYYIVADIR